MVGRWANAFAKVAGPLSLIACVAAVTTIRPAPGKFLPMSWNIGVIVGTIVVIGLATGLGALFGYLVWLLKWRGRE